MIVVSHHVLIDALSGSARPVKRLRSSWLRMLGWIAVALPCGALISSILDRTYTDWTRPGAGWAAVVLLSSFVVGALAIVTALDTSIPGRGGAKWRWFALPVTAWLVATIASMMISLNPIGRIGSGIYCYVFMVLASLPMIAVSIVSLRQTRTLAPERCLAIAGLGVAFMTMTLLKLCHPVTENLLDFVGHLLAAATIVGATILCGRRWVAI